MQNWIKAHPTFDALTDAAVLGLLFGLWWVYGWSWALFLLGAAFGVKSNEWADRTIKKYGK